MRLETCKRKRERKEQNQGYYNTGWLKKDLSACWSKKNQLSITLSVCVNAPLEITALNLEMIECPLLNTYSVPIWHLLWEIRVS